MAENKHEERAQDKHDAPKHVHVEEEDIVDPLIKFREECIEHTGKWKRLLDECTERVNSKIKTKENCHHEMVDYIQALDHCALPKVFATLK